MLVWESVPAILKLLDDLDQIPGAVGVAIRYAPVSQRCTHLVVRFPLPRPNSKYQ